jgi:hypothetical protein
MTLLTLVQKTCRRINLNIPNSAYANADPQIQQIVELCNEEGQSSAERYPWQVLRAEGSFTTVATETQTTLSTCAPGFKYLINNTFFDRTLQREIRGPVSPTEWQLLKAQQLTGPYYQYTVRGNSILFNPIPTAGESVYFEYISKNWVSNAAASNTDSTFSADDDYALLDEDIMLMGIIWRWKQVKGFEYGEDFNKYEARIADAMARDGTKPTISMNGSNVDVYPGVRVPSGNWNL